MVGSLARRKAKREPKVFPKIGKKTCRSTFEFQTWEQMSGLLPNGTTLSYENDKLTYTTNHTYLIDFTLIKKDGSVIYIETKGYFDSADRAKHLAIKAQHPSADIRFVFMRDNLIHSKSKTKYSDWAEKHGFKWAVKEVPEDWINE